jgi:hypothetical protein
MSHHFTYPKVTEIRRVSLEISGPPIRQGTARAATRLRSERR